MATLAELKQIQTNSTADPGEPPDSNIVAARELLGRLEAAVWLEIEQIRATPPPRGTPEQNQANNEALGWAQNALDTSEALARKALKLLLARRRADAVEILLALDDPAIEGAVDAVIPLFSKGSFPGRR